MRLQGDQIGLIDSDVGSKSGVAGQELQLACRLHLFSLSEMRPGADARTDHAHAHAHVRMQRIGRDHVRYHEIRGLIVSPQRRFAP